MKRTFAHKGEFLIGFKKLLLTVSPGTAGCS